MTYGLTPTGITIPPAAEILADVEARQRSAPSLGTDVDVSPESPLGVLNGIVAAKLREVWEAAAALYAARRPSTASGDQLDAACEVTAIARQAATYGKVTLTLSVAAHSTVPAGSVARIPAQPSNRWVTLADATNTGGATASIDVAASSEATGPQRANAGTITGIATPVAGWLGVTNALDAIPGANAETDPELRTRRFDVIRAGGSSPLDAVRVALLRVPGVASAQVFENADDVADAEGRPPHSIEALVLGGDDGDVAAALRAAKAGGIQAWGSTAVSVIDGGGGTRWVMFSRPTDRLGFVRVTLAVNPSNDPGDDAIKAAAVAPFVGLVTGQLAKRVASEASVFALAGVRDVTEVALGWTAGTVMPTNLDPGARNRPVFDTSRVEVVRG